MASEQVLINLNSLAAASSSEISPEQETTPLLSPQLILKGHCFICLKCEETPPSWMLSHSSAASLINGSSSNAIKEIKSFQPLLCYLTGKSHQFCYPADGDDPTHHHDVIFPCADNDDQDEFKVWLSIMRDLPPVCDQCHEKLALLYRLHQELLELQRRIQDQTVEIRNCVKKTVEDNQRNKYLETIGNLNNMAFEQAIDADEMSRSTGLVIKLHDQILSKGTSPVIFPFGSPPAESAAIIDEQYIPVAPQMEPMTFLDVEISPNNDDTSSGDIVGTLSSSSPKKQKVQVEFISIDEYTDNTAAGHIYVTPMEEDQVVEISMGQDMEQHQQDGNQFEVGSIEVVENEDTTCVNSLPSSSSLVAHTLPSTIAPISTEGDTDAAVNVAGVPVDPSANYVMITTNVTDPTTGVVSVQPILISVAQLQAMQQQQQMPTLATDAIISTSLQPPASAVVTTTPKNKSSRKEPIGAYSTPSEYVYFHEDQQPCDVCNARIPRGSEVASHLATHVGSDYVFYCGDCRIGFISPFRLEQYHRSKPVRCRLDTSSPTTTGPLFSCNRCPFQADKVKPFKKHLDQHDSEEGQTKSFQCPLCPLRFSDKLCVELHLGEKHVFTKPSGRQKCDVCGSFFDLGEIEAHLWSHGIGELLRCKLCMCIFSSVEAIIEHQTVVKRRGLHDISCHVCESRFIRVKDLRLHYFEEHSLGTKYVCSPCQEEFFTVKLFEAHRKKCELQQKHQEEESYNVESSEEEAVVLPSPSSSKLKSVQTTTTKKSCPECSKLLSTSDILLRHRIKEHGHPPLKCPRLDCHQTFSSEGDRKTHVATDHQGFTLIKKPYSCNQCSETFAKREKLKSHKFVKHSDAKPFSCDVCGLQYRNKVTLQDHINFKHLGMERQRNKKCDICNRCFADSQVLKHHKLIHTNERPFGCKKCGQRFRQKTALRTHERSHDQLGDAFKPKGEMERNNGSGKKKEL